VLRAKSCDITNLLPCKFGCMGMSYQASSAAQNCCYIMLLYHAAAHLQADLCPDVQILLCCLPRRICMFSQVARKVSTLNQLLGLPELLTCHRQSYGHDTHHDLDAAALLQELVTPAQHEANIKLQFLERAKGEDGSAQIQKLINVLKNQAAQGSVGALPKVNI